METDTEPLVQMLRMITSLTPAVTIASDGGEWRACPMDASHVAMAEVAVTMEGWPDGTFAVDAEVLLGALKSHKRVDISVEDGWLTVASSGYRRRMRLLEPETPRSPPAFDSEATCIADSDGLRGVVGAFDAKRMEKVAVALSPEGLTMEVGDERDEAVATIPAGDMEVPPEGEARAMYPLGHWQSFLKAVPAGRMLEISLSSDRPVTVDFSGGGVRGRWMCAPRIESD